MHKRYSEIKIEKENETSCKHIFYVINKLKRNHMNEHRIEEERKSGGTTKS